MAILTTIERSILKTLIYFDIFEFPLTAWEIYKYLYIEQPVSFLKVVNSLKNLSKEIDHERGFYFLKGKNYLVTKRQASYLNAKHKISIAQKNVKLLSRLPFIKAIFLCNSLSYSNAHPDSDVDLFIVTKKSRVWTARFFINGLMKVLNRRPLPKNTRDKICLSFLVDEDQLDLKPFSYPKDIYLYYWLNQLNPLYDPDNFLTKIQHANLWAKKNLANSFPLKNNQMRRVIKSRFLNLLTSFIASLIKEKTYQKWQIKIMPDRLRENNGSKNIIFNEHVIKLHDHDRRVKYRDEWLKRCQMKIPNLDLTDLVKLIGKGFQL